MTLDDLQTTIGVQFKDKELLQRAFIHRSHLK
jgi:dsRNA-specific ribonuclease